MSETSELEQRALRKDIRGFNGYTVGCEELRLLCPGYMTAGQQFNRIAAIAQHEGWSFAFLPIGSVHFGTY